MKFEEKFVFNIEIDMGLDIDRVIEQDTVHSHLKCSICMDVLENPLQAPCQHTFCKQCISQWLNRGNNTCPEDRQRLSLSELKPPRIIQDLLIKLTIRCKNHEEGCRLLAKYEDMNKLIVKEVVKKTLSEINLKNGKPARRCSASSSTPRESSSC